MAAPKLAMVAHVAEQDHPQQHGCCFVAAGNVATSDALRLPAMLAPLLKLPPLGDNATALQWDGPEPRGEQLLPTDHVFTPEPPPPGTPVLELAPGDSAKAVVLYGSPGLPCFAPLHTTLRVMASASGGRLQYAWRPLLQPHCLAWPGGPGEGG